MELSIAILMKLQIDWILKSETQFPSFGTVAALRAQRTGYIERERESIYMRAKDLAMIDVCV
jgi:hypothetical protein